MVGHLLKCPDCLYVIDKVHLYTWLHMFIKYTDSYIHFLQLSRVSIARQWMIVCSVIPHINQG